MSRLAVYKRVSTDKQDVAMQDHAVAQWLAARPPGDQVLEFVDEGISGKTLNRPRMQDMLEAIRSGQVDGVVVYRLDRISRDAITALRLLMDWMQLGIEFYAIEQPILSATKSDPLRLTKMAMFSELAQIERDTLISRVRSGLAAARARGVKLGAPRSVTEQQRQEITSLAAGGMRYRDIAKATGVSIATISRTIRG